MFVTATRHLKNKPYNILNNQQKIKINYFFFNPGNRDGACKIQKRDMPLNLHSK